MTMTMHTRRSHFHLPRAMQLQPSVIVIMVPSCHHVAQRLRDQTRPPLQSFCIPHRTAAHRELKAIPRCQDKDWYRGKAENKPGERPQAYIMAQKRRMAEVAMSLKRNIVRPTPATVRADDRV